MTSKRLAIALLAVIPAIGADKPHPDLTPAQVVEAQVEALQFNDRPTPDAGIATAFRFASPDNRKVTGPLPRFAQIVRAPGYRPLIDHRVAGYGALIVRGDVALRRVTVVADDGQGSSTNSASRKTLNLAAGSPTASSRSPRCSLSTRAR